MCKRRKLLVGLGLMLLLLAVAGSWLLYMPDTAVTEANFDKIAGGFTLEQVERLMGRHADATTAIPANDGHVQQQHWWEARNLCLGVYFENDRVVGKSFSEREESFWDKVRRLCPWIKRVW